ncbi:MAG: HipA domain-containing protein [Paludibacteraceae bacterium]|nr:HipA domain-containing protein [Paludibacteraceae bacterium]
MCKCLYCYKELEQGQVNFHPSCARRMFGMTTAPQMDYTREDMDGLAANIIRSQTTLTGVQAKLSLNLTKHEGTKRLTIVGLWGQYIFKPQTDDYEQLPEVEDLTMHLAEDAKLPVARHSLIRLADGSLGYITKRFDRDAKGGKIAMEDMCQLSERKTEDKYKSSYEQIAKMIARYSSVPRLDLTNFFELLLFCWITGNNDMHLKNFSLYCPQSQYVLTPAYDLVNAALVNPQDKEELALTLNGKKSKLKLQDFIQSAERMRLTEKFVEQTVERFDKFLPLWRQTISRSFVSDELKQGYMEMLQERLQRLRG